MANPGWRPCGFGVNFDLFEAELLGDDEVDVVWGSFLFGDVEHAHPVIFGVWEGGRLQIGAGDS